MKAGERRLVRLADGTRLYLNEKTEVAAIGPRQLTLHKGQIYLEVAPQTDAPRFVVKTANREITAKGTHFAVMADPLAAGLVVTQGTVAVKGMEQEVIAGQQIAPATSSIIPAPRASHTLAWTRELMAAAESPLVPACQHAGGALVAVDPNGQEIKLSLRHYHIDVHIEDGFARTTIDQTYFNTTWDRLEGTFYFPLPADASLSRLAMYVADGNQCKLMEGGMAERQHAANIYETIRYQRRDPALLEWLDGSTFKMRVFPLEAKQEKRILLSYTQKLPTLYGVSRYRFAGGLNMPIVREWSFNARIKSGAGMNVWSTTQADAHILPQGGDTLVRHYANNVKPEADVAVEMQDKNAALDKDEPRFTSFLFENQQYLMLRYRPTLPSLPERQRRDWIILFESSAGRDPLLAGTQVDVVRQILKNAEYDDTFTLLTLNSKTQIQSDKAQPARPKNVEDALKLLQETHLVGALDLQQGLQAALKVAKETKNPHLLHIGTGIPAMGERDAGKLAALLPESVRYVGVGVGKRWNRAFMKAAAERTGGLFTQINPDEAIAWRAFDLYATLNTPRLLDVQVFDANGKARFLMETSMIAQGEELCALTRVDTNQSAVPGKVVLKGTLDGKAFTKEFPVMNVQSGAGYLPRTWAKLEIDRLLAENASKHKNEIISLSKAMYVMSPFTSLLVLETDADYVKYNVDKGRKDHWAMYACPPKIPLVYEPDGKAPPKEEKKDARKKPNVEEILATMVGGRHSLHSFNGPGSLNEQTDRMKVLALNPAIVSDDDPIHFPPLATWRAITKTRKDKYEEATPGDLPLLLDISAGRPLWDRGNAELNSIGLYPPALALIVRKPGRPNTSITGGIIGGKARRVDATSFDDLRRMELARGGRPMSLGRGGFAKDKLPGSTTPEEFEGTRRRQRLFYDVEGDQKAKSNNEIFQFWTGMYRDEGRAAAKKQADAIVTMGGEIPPVIFMGPTSSMRGFMDIDGSITSMTITKSLERVLDQQRIVQTQTQKIQADVIKKLDEAIEKLPHTLAIMKSKRKIQEAGYDQLSAERELLGFRPISLRYERPAFEYDPTLSTDLVQYAPGLSTNYADILATIEAEADLEAPKLGAIDPAAGKLIERARAADWAALTVPAQGPLPVYKIAYNRSGQFSYERLLVSGLREEVVCDGKTLWHRYPEIGLASKRPFSRHHQHLAAAIDPAFLPPIEEMARGGDVKAIDAATIALIPFGAAELKKDTKYVRVHLIFAKDGGLAERRIVEMPSGKTILRQLFFQSGAIEWHDADGKVLAREERTVTPAKAPSLQPMTDELVVLEMPTRSHQHWRKRWALDPQPYYVEQILVSECVEGGRPASDVLFTFGVNFHQKGDRRLGFYTLFRAAGYHFANETLPLIEKKPWTIDLEKDHPQSALAMWLARCQEEAANNDRITLTNLPGPKDGFIARLAQFSNLWRAWHHQRPLQDGAKELPLYKGKVHAFLQETTSPTFAYAVLDVMQRRSNSAPSDHMLSLAEKRFGPISDPAGLGYVFRYEHARSLQQAGLGADASKRFRDLYADTLQLGLAPPIDAAFRDALQMPGAGGPKFIAFTRKTLDDLVAKKRYGLAFQLAKQMEQLGDEALCEEYVAAIVAKAADKERDAITFAAVRFQSQRKNYAQADRLLVQLLADKELSQYPELWRWRHALTKSNGQTAVSIACLEKALELEYAELPELVNLECLRADYRTLLTHYQTIAEASASLGSEPLTPNASPRGRGEKPKAFIAKIIRATDRWRLIDADAAEPSMMAGKIFAVLGEHELAWDYWTTPIDLHPAESKPWLDLAESMIAQGDFERAGRAFGLAFEAEPTNPEILMKRAQNFVRLGQPERARQIYQQIVHGAWQERFNAIVEYARGLSDQ